MSEFYAPVKRPTTPDDLRRTEEYYRALSRITRYRTKESLTRELMSRLAHSERDMIAEEKRKADALLENILPAYMIEELKVRGRVTPANHDRAAVLLTDFVGFTEVTRYMSPRELLRELTRYFDAFEEVLERYRIEKVKTIGDALLCVAGLGKLQENTAPVDAILAATAMMEFTYRTKKQYEERGEQAWGMRAAVHYGSLVAGVVGHSKIAFDIWGHTVNVVSRIETLAQPNTITISRSVFDRVRDFFDCDFLGEFELKGVGFEGLYAVRGFRTNLRKSPDQSFTPNDKFWTLYSYLKQGAHILRKEGRYRISRPRPTMME